MRFAVLARAEFLTNIQTNPRVCSSVTTENDWSPRALLLGDASIACRSGDGHAWEDWKSLWFPRWVSYQGSADKVAESTRHIEEELKMPMLGLKMIIGSLPSEATTTLR